MQIENVITTASDADTTDSTPGSSVLTIYPPSATGNPVPLHVLHKGQFEPQGAYLELSEGGEVSYGVEPLGGGAPPAVWLGRTTRWSVSPYLSRDAARRLLDDPELIRLLERVYAGRSSYWDGRNFVGELDDDAAAASSELAERLDLLDFPSLEACDKILLEVLEDPGNWLGDYGSSEAQDTLFYYWPADMSLEQAVEKVKADILEELDAVISDTHDVRVALLAILEDAIEQDYEPAGEHYELAYEYGLLPEGEDEDEDV